MENMADTIETQIRNIGGHQKELTARLKVVQKPEELFNPPISSLRLKIKAAGEAVIRQDLAQAREHDVFRLLWKHAFYNVIDEFRRLRKKEQQADFPEPLRLAFLEFLLEASGFFHHLIGYLRDAFRLSLRGKVDYHVWGSSNNGSEPHHQHQQQQLQHIAMECCHQCLVYLGDLARYREMFATEPTPPSHSHAPSHSEATRYYIQALLVLPGDGTPHNQLAILAGAGPDRTLSALYHYFRCVSSVKVFSHAEPNLQSLLATSQKPKTPQQALLDPFDRLKDAYLKVVYILYGRHKLEAFDTKCDDAVLTLQQYLERGDGSIAHKSETMFHVIVANIALHHRELSTPSDVASLYIDLCRHLAIRLGCEVCQWVCGLLVAEPPFDEDHIHAALCAVKTFMVWLETPDMSQCLADSRTTLVVRKLWGSLAQLLSLISRPLREQSEEWDFTALSEDLELLGLAPLSGYLKRLKFTELDRDSEKHQRLLALRSLGVRLASQPHSGLRFDAQSEAVFSAPSAFGTSLLQPGSSSGGVAGGNLLSPSSAAAGTSAADQAAAREKVMRAMAQQRLESEVSRLQSMASAAGQQQQGKAAPTPVVVVDAPSLALNLSLFKELMVRPDLVVVIPASVISGLDDMKKGNERVNKGARDAVHLLEQAARESQGRVVAATAQHVLPLPESLAVSDDLDDSRRGILGTCMYFAAQQDGGGGGGGCLRPDLVTLLTSDEDLRGLAVEAGFAVQTLSDFLRALKTSPKRRHP
eukprot:m.144974 g.144974  ORF g.144974 m.144974 type:complete len:756 (+) comp16777_c0_seq3:128-2395(+)